MTSPATSCRHLLKFEKTAENAAFGFGLNFSDAARSLPQPIGELLVNVLLYDLVINLRKLD